MSAGFPGVVSDAASFSAAGSLYNKSSSGRLSLPEDIGTTYGQRPAPRGTAAYPRKRANKACQVCRARRTKCDNKRPSCSFCEKAGTKCVWAPHDLSSFDPASLAILERFDQLESLIRSTSNQTQTLQQPTTPVFGASPLSETQRQGPTGQSLGLVAITSIDFRLEVVLTWQPLREILGRFSLPSSQPLPKETLYQGSILGLEDLDIVTCNRHLDKFWRNVHCKNPILVYSEVRKWINQIILNGITWDAKSCLVLLICALGTLSTDFRPQESVSDPVDRQDVARDSAQAQYYFAAAQKRLTACLGKRGILEAQCFFYCGVYLVTTMQPTAAWSMFLQAKASCQSFDWLIEAVAEEPAYTPELKRSEIWVAEECTYWTCLKSEIELRLELHPPGFRSLDLWYPNRFPDPPKHTEQDSDRAWFFYLAEIALRRLANRILTFIGTSYHLDDAYGMKCAQESAAEFEQEANDWVKSLPSPPELTKSGDDVLSFILKGHLTNCYELIYWPFVKHALNTPSDNYAYANDEHVRRGLLIALDRLEVNKPGFKHQHHGTYFLIRSCTRSAFVLLAAHFKRGLENLMPVGWHEKVWSIINLLEFWQDKFPPAGQWRDSMVYLMQEAQRQSL